MQMIDLLAAKGNIETSTRLQVPIRDETGLPLGSLCCLDRGLVDRADLVSAMTEWRNQSMRFFLTQFTATPDRTKQWLKNVVLPAKDRILFVILDIEGEPIGNFGLANISSDTVEVDNVLRRQHATSKNIMFYASVALIHWAFQALGVDRTQLHVFETNDRALRLYKRLGFEVSEHFQLRRTERDNLIEYIKADDANATEIEGYLKMELTKKGFRRTHPWIDRC
ncbi:GNAT family N-acetyltransferase [Rhizobium tubonense]|uniref:GNAT family N-acetyltransferase n=1 Tax=Rhizobium tubonense TaxID=484088 RepID=A0A2W4C1P3_9HYPH|nr:GNAT family N-acetyltransferase [Rhizobium tubonense]PZM07417.1 GNAT family N-acetyltransferase [Rhizobium tubonense]